MDFIARCLLFSTLILIEKRLGQFWDLHSSRGEFNQTSLGLPSEYKAYVRLKSGYPKVFTILGISKIKNYLDLMIDKIENI